MHAVRFVPLFVFAALCLISCSPEPSGSGEAIEESRILAPFEVLRLECPADVRVFEAPRGDEPKVIVRVEGNLMPLVVTTVKDPKLTIAYTEDFKSQSGVSIDVYSRGLMKVINASSGTIRSGEKLRPNDFSVVLEGSGDIDLELRAEDLLVRNEGSGDIQLKGSVQRANVLLDGSGDIDARACSAREMDADNEGSGQLTVEARLKLKGLVSGSGDLRYVFKGRESNLKLEQDGTGQIIELAE